MTNKSKNSAGQVVKVDGVLYLPANVVAEAVNKDMSVIVASVSMGRRCWQGIRSPADRRELLIRIDTLKPRYANAIKAQMGDIAQLHQQQQRAAAMQNLSATIGRLPIKNADLEAFRSVKNKCGGRAYADSQIVSLARSCSLLAWLAAVSTADAQRIGYANKTELMGGVCDYLFAAQWGFAPKNTLLLYRKIAEYQSHGHKALITDRIGNANANKLSDTAKLYLRLLYRRHNKYTYPQMYDLLRAKAEQMEWQLPKLTTETVRNYLRRPDVKAVCFLERHDSHVWHKHFDQHILRYAPTHPHDMWIMDGWTLELYYREQGNKYPRRLLVFFIIDAATWAVVGYAISNTGGESMQLTQDAMRNAYRNTGVMPLQWQFDHGPGQWNKDSQAWFATLNAYVTPTEVGNAKAKAIEPFFKTFNQQVIKLYPNWAGGNIDNKLADNRKNDTWLRENHKELPTHDTIVAEIADAVQTWNNRPVSIGRATAVAPAEAIKKPHRARLLTIDDEIALWWRFRKDADGTSNKQYRYTQNGIQFQYQNKLYQYRVYDDAGQTDYDFWLNHADEYFYIKYDPDDMDMIALYSTNNKYVGLATTLRLAPMAIADRKDNDGAWISKEQASRKEFAGDQKKKITHDNEALRQIGIDPEELHKGAWLNKSVKTDLNTAEEALKSPLYQRKGTLAVLDNED